MTCHFCKSRAKKFGKYGTKRIQRYRCLQCGKTFSEPQDKPLDEMRISPDTAIKIIQLLVEGVGINAVSRIVGVHKQTVLATLALAGQRASELLDRKMRGLHLNQIQCDEIWTFVYCKEKNIRPELGPAVVGDQYVYVSIDRETKLAVNFLVGRRNTENTDRFVADLHGRLDSRVQLSTDGLRMYIPAIDRAFGADVDYGQIVKIYARQGGGHYSPPECIAAVPTPITGNPDPEMICTSHVERSNLSMRTFLRRMTRLCLGFSKKLDNLKYAVALYFAWYNFVRVHSSLSVTPAMEAGVTDHVWNLSELLSLP